MGGVLGAEVVSSSLGYIDWYSFEDMDGRTAVTTRAANRATSLGVVVVNAAGNERAMMSGATSSLRPTGLTSSPAGPWIAIGQIASFSSPGPTYDGRIKPEVCALGVNNGSPPTGRTGATPTGQGIGDFVLPRSSPVWRRSSLEIHRDWTPAQVRQALLSTASLSQNPTNDYGWGIADAALAADSGLPVVGLDRVAIDDDASGNSRGNANGRPEPGETVELTVTLENKGRAAVAGLSGALSTAQSGFTVSPSSVAFPALAPGAAGGAGTPFIIRISPDFMGRHVILRLRVDGPQGPVLFENIELQIFR